VTSTLLLGKSKELEIAGQLTRHGLLVYFPFVDIGADLVVSGEDMSRFIPIQVKYRKSNPAIGLEKEYLERLSGKKMVLAFIIGTGGNSGTWYIPLTEFKKKAKAPARKDNRVYISINENRKWLEKFEGENGLLRLKKQLAI